MQKISVPILNESFEDIIIYSKNSSLLKSSEEPDHDNYQDLYHTRIYYQLEPHYSVKEINLTGEAIFLFNDLSDMNSEKLIFQGTFIITTTSISNFRTLMNKFSQFIFSRISKIIIQENIKNNKGDNFMLPLFEYSDDHFKDLPEKL